MDQPKEVQLAALKASDGHAGFGYWMEMGLGKTYTTLLDFMRQVEREEATRLVVVCPNSFKSGWRDEIIKQEINTDCHIFESGGDNTEFFRRKYNRPPTLIVNYEAIRREHVQDYIFNWIRGRGAMIAFDESIQLKNNKSQQTKAAIDLSKEFKFRRTLTGKPITQGPHDLWGQMRAMGHLSGYNYYAFRGMFCRMGGYMNKKVIGAQNEEALGKLIDPHVFRATKDQWTDLPPKVYTVREAQMTSAQAAKYRSMEEEFLTWLSDTEYVSVDMALTKHIKLAQIQFGFLIDENGVVHEIVPPEANPRLQLIKNVLEDELEGKLVVVYHHKYAGRVLEEGLREYNPAFIRGGMTAHELTGNKDRFNKSRDCRVICIQTIAGKYGHTLVGMEGIDTRCSTMIFPENTWSLDTRSQLEDRIHRFGQVGDSCLYIDLVSSPLDRKMVRALQNKESVFQAVMAHIGREVSEAEPSEDFVEV